MKIKTIMRYVFVLNWYLFKGKYLIFMLRIVISCLNISSIPCLKNINVFLLSKIVFKLSLWIDLNEETIRQRLSYLS